jgi:2-polyprenyl-6-methoxyphenol hydroxylase-like FAD-dependent oxidoreductase
MMPALPISADMPMIAAPLVVILGGGLAGMSTALELRRRDIPTMVLERHPLRKWKIGESLSPTGVKALEAIGLSDKLRAGPHLASSGLLSAWGGAELRSTDFIYNPYGCGYQVDRAALENSLFLDAQTAGATVFQGAVLKDMVRHGTGWTLDTSVGKINTQYIVDATGRSAFIARRLGRRQLALDRLVAVFARSAPTEERIDSRTVIEACHNGWWYAAVTASRRHTLAFHSDVDLLKQESWQHPEWFLQALVTTTHISQLQTGSLGKILKVSITAANSCRLDQFGGDGWLAVGDSAIARDPLSGQGMTMAVEAGIAAAAALAAGRRTAITAYCSRLESEWEDYKHSRHHYYNTERRWTNSAFWQRRHQHPVSAKAAAT